jgi:hypothetical protein
MKSPVLVTKSPWAKKNVKGADLHVASHHRIVRSCTEVTTELLQLAGGRQQGRKGTKMLRNYLKAIGKW